MVDYKNGSLSISSLGIKARLLKQDNGKALPICCSAEYIDTDCKKVVALHLEDMHGNPSKYFLDRGLEVYSFTVASPSGNNEEWWQYAVDPLKETTESELKEIADGWMELFHNPELERMANGTQYNDECSICGLDSHFCACY